MVLISCLSNMPHFAKHIISMAYRRSSAQIKLNGALGPTLSNSQPADSEKPRMPSYPQNEYIPLKMARVSFDKFWANIVSTDMFSIMVAIIIEIHEINASLPLGLSTKWKAPQVKARKINANGITYFGENLSQMPPTNGKTKPLTRTEMTIIF